MYIFNGLHYSVGDSTGLYIHSFIVRRCCLPNLWNKAKFRKIGLTAVHGHPRRYRWKPLSLFQAFPLLTALLTSSLTKYPNFVSLSPVILLLHPYTHPPSNWTFQFLFFHASIWISHLILFNCPNKQSDSDPIPTWLLKVCAPVLTPTVTNIVNQSLTSGHFHPILKEFVPLLKKPRLL